MKTLIIFAVTLIVMGCNGNTSTKTIANTVIAESLDTISEGGLSDWELFIKHFPRKKSTVVRDYAGNVIKEHSLGVLNTRVTSVQQCADAAIRLRAEFLYSRKEYNKIKFKLTSGLEVPFSKWALGYRVKVNGNRATLIKTQSTNDYSRNNFEEYLKVIMTYAGSASLSRDLLHSNVPPKIGDLLVLGGYPGHVVIIIDKKQKNGINYYLFANSWIPAQDIEIVTGTSTGGKTIDNYIPITGKTVIQINGYKFQTPIDIRTWQDQD